MSAITAIVTAYRRPDLLCPQTDAIRRQSHPPQAVWLWANQPDHRLLTAIDSLEWDRAVICRDNAYVHARFALALLAPTEYVAIFDDDALPGPDWFANCLRVMASHPGILGTAGVRLQGDNYRQRTVHGWHAPSEETVEVDLVGHAWFLRTEWVRYLFAAAPVVGTNGEDIELAARALRLGGIRCFCPPHPLNSHRDWGSLRGADLGSDAAALSRRPGHLDERDRVVRAEITAGWQPLCRRSKSTVGALLATPTTGSTFSSRALQGEPPMEDSRLAALLQAIPTSALRILHVGCGAGHLGAVVKARQRCWIKGTEIDAKLAVQAQTHLDEVVGGIQELHLQSDQPSFDCVLWDRPDTWPEPEQCLHHLCGLLHPEGRLVALFPNARQLAWISALLDGNWGYEPAGPIEPTTLRYFTRREVEKLFHRTGFRVAVFQALPGPDHQDWVKEGQPGIVRVGPLHITGLPPSEAEEFHTTHYLVQAVPRPAPTFGLTSIVIVTHNELPYTRECLNGIRLRTDEPYELILVDNGSTDGTADYLRALPNAHVIINTENRGYPAAANQGIRAASGDHILFLNNDTIVTTSWLPRLLNALHADPKVGLVGPCSNRVSGEQQIPVSYDDDLVGLDGFAWEWGKANDQRRDETDRLVGFCLLARRAVVDQIGHLDERFGIGCFEDDDYCRRALQAGFRAVIARDAFVHHFGSRTFLGTGVDYAALMRRNQELFQEKWQAIPSAATLVPSTTIPQQMPSYRARMAAGGGLLLERQPVGLSLCMIVRNNARTIEACLQSIRPWVDEMVVVDTGSTDDTPARVERLGARLYHFPWCDSFSVARNESLKHARGRWVFWMDSDDIIDPANGRKLRQLALQDAAPPLLGYVMQVHCPGPGDDGQANITVVDHVKLFRNLPELRFEGRIHEQILPSIRRAGGEVLFTDVFVVHAGYDHSPGGQERKIQRDLHLLTLELQEQPKHPFTLFNLGMTYADIGQYEKAVEYLHASLEHAGEGESHLRKVHALLVNCYFQLGQMARAWEACQQGLRGFPGDPELRFRQAMLMHESGKLAEAVNAYQDLLQHAGGRHFSSVDKGITGFKARQNLAVVYTAMGDLARAEEQWLRVTQEVPGYRSGWRGLGDALLRQAKHSAAKALAQKLVRDPALRGEGHLLKGRLAAAENDISLAGEELRRAATALPDDIEPLRIRCQLLFEQGAPAETQQALLELVRRDPSDAAAHHNLGTIYALRKNPAAAAAAYRRSLHYRPNSAPTHYHLGCALHSLGRRVEAIKAWQHALQLEPGHAEARAALAQVR